MKNGTNKFRNKKLIVEYTIRYGIVIFITMVLAVFMMVLVLNQYRKEIIYNTEEKFKRSMVSLEEMLVGQEDMAREIYLNRLTKHSYMTKDNFQAAEGVRQLQILQKSLLINDYIFVRYTDNELYTHNGSVTCINFMEKTLELEVESEKVFIQALNDHGNKSVVVLNDKSGKRYTVFLYPVLNNYTDTNHMVGFIIGEANLKEYFEEKISGIPFYASVITENGEQIAAICTIENLSEVRKEELEQIFATQKSLLGRNYTVNKYHMISGLQVHVAFANNQIFASFNQLLKILMLLGIAIFAFVFALLVYINRSNVRKIYELKNYLLKYDMRKERTAENENELQVIESLIHQMYLEQKEKEEKRKQFYQTMSVQIANLFLGGLIEKEDVLREIVAQLRPELKNPYYTVLGVATAIPPDILPRYLCAEEPFTLYSVSEHGENTVISFVIGLDDADEDGNLREELSRKLIFLAEQNEINDIKVMAGRPYRRYREIHRSYNEMISLYKVIMDNRVSEELQIYIFERILRKRNIICFDEEQESALKVAIRTGDLTKVEETLQNIVHNIMSRNEAAISAFGFYTLIQLLYEIMQEKNYDAKQLSALLRISYADADNFVCGVMKLLHNMPVKQSSDIDHIMDYIASHYKENTIGLESLAAHFNMSASNVSKYIKTKSGQNYTEYIVCLRMSEACRLLAETDLSVQEVTYEVGYNDYVSFSKKFKKMKGMSPSEYRKIKHGEDSIKERWNCRNE